uniref:Uncharacterized protein n=1 Tax=Gasterosteus aculeatus aculeatus TaxID=481459 RepID=A0AAQ4R5M9_GASAC
EDQISKLVLEKQELEWETSLQHQMEMLSNQHSESLVSVKKQVLIIVLFQGKYQISAELKDKEINNLKEKLKSLQLLKYNLEKRSNELVRRDFPLQTVDRGSVGVRKIKRRATGRC